MKFTELLRKGSNFLESGDAVRSLEAYTRAEAMNGDDPAMCGALGDMAVAYNRIGNPQKAIATYERAIALCQRYGDALNLSRWTTNLVALLISRGANEQAENLLPQMLEAAEATGDARQVGAAASTAGQYFAEQQRFAEAEEWFAHGLETASGPPEIEALLRDNLATVRLALADAAFAQNRATDASAVLGRFFADPPASDDLMLRALMLRGSLAERAGDPHRARNDLRAAVDIARRLGYDEIVTAMTQTLDAEPSSGLRTSALAPEKFRAEIDAALDSHDVEAELSARVNYAATLLQHDLGDALTAFDETIPRLRARADRRRELVLSLNFVVPILEMGETGRAVALAQRCVEISATARVDHRLLAYLLSGRVAVDAQHDWTAAVAAFTEAARLLEESDLDADDRELLLPEVAEAATRLLEADELALALRLGRAGGMELPDLPVTPAVAALDVDALCAATDPRLDGMLSRWRASPVQPRAVTSLLDLFDYLAERMDSGVATTVDGASAGGPGGLLQVAELLAQGHVSASDAEAATRSLAVTTDDATALVAYVARHENVERGTQSALVQLVVKTTDSAPLAACLCRFLMLSAPGSAAALAHARRGVELLGDADIEIRADLLNETSVNLQQLGRAEEAMAAAQAAADAAGRLGLEQIEGMALGNLASSLLQLGRADEAIPVFEQLERDQERRGELDQLELTRYNLRAARAAAGSDEQFAAESDDPDEILQRAALLTRQGEPYAAVKLFERAFSQIKSGQPSATEWGARANYAIALHALGRVDAALDQLDAVARRYEHDNPALAAQTLGRMVTAVSTQPLRARGYAERAVRAANASGDPRVRAHAYAVLGALQHEGQQFASAVDALSTALKLDDDPKVRIMLGDALARARRPDEALAQLDEVDAESVEPASRVLQRAARANALAERGDRIAALVELRTAYALELEHQAELDPTSCFGSRALAFALLEDGAVSEALTVLESVTSRLHNAGVEDPERLVGLETAQTLSAMGDATGADAVLARIAERATANGDDTRLARALCIRANVAIQRGDLHSALDYAQTARDLATSVSDRHAEATAVDLVGTVERLEGRFDQAAQDHAAAVRSFRAADSPRDELVALLNLAEARYCARDPYGAEETLVEIDSLLDDTSAPAMLWNAHLLSALVMADKGQWPAAREALRTSFELLHGSDLSGAAGSARQRLRREERVHRLATNAAVRADDGKFALEIVESGRARFLRTVMERRRSRPAGTSDADWLRYERAADALAELRVRRRNDLLLPDPELARESSEAERELAHATAAVFGEHQPDKTRSPFPRFEDLLRPLPAEVAVVAVDVVEDGIQLVCAGRDATGALWSEAALDPRMTRADLPDPEQLRDPTTLARLCRTLGRQLWPAVLERLTADTSRLVVLPSARLAGLPLGAATLPEGRRAAERFCLTFAPSLSLISDRTSRPATGLLGQVVDPTGDLPFSRFEARAVAALHDGPTTVCPGPAATPDAVLELMRSADVLLFAGHAAFDVDDPVRSFLRCAPSRDDHGRLTVTRTLGEVATPPDVVVLAACESSSFTPDDPFDELVGLPGILLATGTRWVVGSLWEVGDIATSLLVPEFFRRWNWGAVHPARALAQAQAWLREEVSYDDVARLTDSLAREAPDDERLRAARDEWAARRGDDSPAFADELSWAAFTVTGAA
ncbi:CHAT domain-containing protein [Amycolatopsis sp. FBCC-B4732]|uniref:CHAT domain-containing protein n=1 Tax=Amycolatopsis sp. FBCC-B4732 TaxID=3079339 RepID=UPI001FF63EE4|nr:CHAT domain-containing protein [Amycolatopsis sp. FBCC-B4732]UOX90432.1 CHAT domain-containing protein [Amycolatopsis sp. FBCC-B4732]